MASTEQHVLPEGFILVNERTQEAWRDEGDRYTRIDVTVLVLPNVRPRSSVG